MAQVLAFPSNRIRLRFSTEDLTALDRLVRRFRSSGAVEIEIDGAGAWPTAYIVGTEGETLLIVTKSTAGVTVRSGLSRDAGWTGRAIADYR